MTSGTRTAQGSQATAATKRAPNNKPRRKSIYGSSTAGSRGQAYGVTAAILTITGLPYHAAGTFSRHSDQILRPEFREICPLELRHDHGNQFDPDAVAVLVPAAATVNGTELMLGYIPRRFSSDVRHWLKAASTFVAAIRPGALSEPVGGINWEFEAEADAALAPHTQLQTAVRDAFTLPFFQADAGVAPRRTPSRRRKDTIRVWL